MRVHAAGGVFHGYHLYVVRVQDRDRVRQRLAERGVMTGIHYPTPIHLMRGYSFLGLGAGHAPAAEQLAREVLSLPMYPELTDADVDHVCATLREAL